MVALALALSTSTVADDLVKLQMVRLPPPRPLIVPMPVPRPALPMVIVPPYYTKANYQ